MLKHKAKWFLVFFLFLFASCIKKQADYKLVELDNFFKPADKSNMLLSPGGDFICYVSNYKNRPNLFLKNLNSRSVIRLTNDTTLGINKYIWLNDSILLYLHDEDLKENYHLYSLNINNRNSLDLTPYPNVKMQLISINPINNTDIYIKLNKRDPNVFDLYRLNALTAELKLVEKNNGELSYWLADSKGEIKLAVATDGVNEKFLIKSKSINNYEEVLSVNFIESFYPICFSEDGNNLYALSNINRDKTALIVYDLLNKQEKSTIYEHLDVDVSDVVFSKLTNKPLYVGYHTSKYQIQSLSKEIDMLQKNVNLNLKGSSFKIINFSKDEKKFLIKTINDKNHGAYYLFSLENFKLELISDENKIIDKYLLSDVKAIEFMSRDGLKLNGYLTLPKIESTKYPLVVIANPSPWTRITWEYNSDVQFLANRGYAVLQVNQRGSDGYGKAFQKAGFKQLGKKMQDDIADGVYHLIREGIVDTARIGIVGFSFGGMMALNGLVKDSNLYKCAVSYSGHINLFSYLKGIPPYYSQYLDMIYEMLGNPEKDNDLFRECSPVFQIEKIKAPVFIAQGENDTRVSSVEVSTLVKNLKKQNTKVNYLLIKEEGHFFKKLENKFTLYSEVESFLELNLKRINDN